MVIFLLNSIFTLNVLCFFANMQNLFIFSAHFPPPCQNHMNSFLLQCATEAVHEIYWPGVPPFDTRNTAYRSCVSYLPLLWCNADLSYLRAIFKPRAPETYGDMGNFIIGPIHLSDLIPACCRSRWTPLYIYTCLVQTRAPATNPDTITFGGGRAAMCSESYLWAAPRKNKEMMKWVLYTEPITCYRKKK